MYRFIPFHNLFDMFRDLTYTIIYEVGRYEGDTYAFMMCCWYKHSPSYFIFITPCQDGLVRALLREIPG